MRNGRAVKDPKLIVVDLCDRWLVPSLCTIVCVFCHVVKRLLVFQSLVENNLKQSNQSHPVRKLSHRVMFQSRENICILHESFSSNENIFIA